VCGPACGGAYAPFDPAAIVRQREIEDNTYQPVLFVAESFEDALARVKAFAQGIRAGGDAARELAENLQPHSRDAGRLIRVLGCMGATRHVRRYVGYALDRTAAHSDACEVVIEAFLCPVCPFSRRAFATMVELQRRHAPRISVRIVPHGQPWHPQSGILALATVAAAQMGFGAEDSVLSRFLTALYAAQAALVDDAIHGMSFDDIMAAATRIAGEANPGLDVEEFHVRARSAGAVSEFKACVRYARQNSLHQSPSFLVNGLALARAESAWSAEDWEQDLQDIFKV
jgi:hypothetical protein